MTENQTANNDDSVTEGSPAWWEQRQPPAQRWLNEFAENWIFALLIAMCVRHFFLEAYRIPSASMEPMLYGDQSITKGDFVLVDKFLFRFTGPERWGVTVFQYPWPEVQGPGGVMDARDAFDASGNRTDNWLTRPPLNRNFVKRVVAMPEDAFFIRGGDVYTQQPSGAFKASVKPDDLIERLWFPIYQHGYQSGYLPWQADAGSTVRDEEGLLSLKLAPGADVHFTQPLVNLYVKQGDILVAPRHEPAHKEYPDLSLLSPQFSWPDGRVGSIWDLENWNVNRRTTEDLDSQSYGRNLNDLMNEYIGDVRLSFTPIDQTGNLTIHFLEGEQEMSLRMQQNGWSLLLNGQQVHQGESGAGKWALNTCDNRAWVSRDGVALHAPIEIAGQDSRVKDQRLRIRFSGEGSVRLGNVTMDRDVHYCHNGITSDENALWRALTQQEAQYQEGLRTGTIDQQVPAGYFATQKLKIIRNRRTYIEQLVDTTLAKELLLDLERAESGRRAKRWKWLQPLAIDAATAVRMPASSYLLMGDNSPHSLDSRNWAFVPEANLRGEVLFSATLSGRVQSVR